MKKDRAAIILAAGKSTRMKSATSKVLHHVGGRSMLAWVKAQADAAGVSKVVCVVGEANQDVRDAAKAMGMEIAVQEPQLGTGHAVLAAKHILADFDGTVTVLYADTPLIRTETTHRVFDALDGADVAVLGFEAADPGAYGRLITRGDELTAIVEAREATPKQLAIQLCNSGVISASRADMFSALSRVTNDNAKGEYYLTDIIEILRSDGKKTVAVIGDEAEVLGVNSREDLAMAEQAFQSAKRAEIMDGGVTLRNPDSVIFAFDTIAEQDAIIGANVVIEEGVRIRKNAEIKPFTHLAGCEIGEGASIGPFARIRPSTNVGENAKIGNFVETKNLDLGKGSKIGHLSYVGDAELGINVNIGAGTITCNYDGYNKHKTIVGDHAFIGTHSSLVAPVTIGEGAFLGSGGVITKDVPDDALAIARADQVNKDGWAKRYHAAHQKRKDK
ncbi:MAG: bifunctional UDP-N-acetylglucosamine diphosphorylase/glucosamine-1-phosphate N-acetyltransferase GlmU [Hellea sp.]|nr:bifunctional UDP-N-acetylglucosamine diphosphorylase/glucosamine-1-phosphate N-acetyltransferase GlmU [Hellea sp.]